MVTSAAKIYYATGGNRRGRTASQLAYENPLSSPPRLRGRPGRGSSRPRRQRRRPQHAHRRNRRCDHRRQQRPSCRRRGDHRATAGLLLSAITDDNRCDSRREVYHAPACRTNVVVTRPYCPAPARVVVVHPAPARHHSREVVVVRPSHRPAPRVVVINTRDGHDRRDERRGDRRDDRRDRYAHNR